MPYIVCHMLYIVDEGICESLAGWRKPNEGYCLMMREGVIKPLGCHENIEANENV